MGQKWKELGITLCASKWLNTVNALIGKYIDMDFKRYCFC